jgi:2-amino-4-hydroxy-6-hydroxymethyldihydropteridine diphosphokinase
MGWLLPPLLREYKIMPQAYLALGSNLGDRAENLQSAISFLRLKAKVITCSAVYETPPWGYEEQPKFLNQVIEVETDLTPGDLLDYVKEVEREIGRKETFRYGPRSIDIDILFYDDLVVNTPPLNIPHAQIAERAFVLVPFADIAPDYVHPVLGRSIENLLSSVDRGSIKFFSPAGCDRRAH